MMCHYCNVMNKTVTLTLTIGSDRNRFTPMQTSYMSTDCMKRVCTCFFWCAALKLWWVPSGYFFSIHVFNVVNFRLQFVGVNVDFSIFFTPFTSHTKLARLIYLFMLNFYMQFRRVFYKFRTSKLARESVWQPCNSY